MVPVIQFWIILEHIYKMSQNLKRFAFFNEHILNNNNDNNNNINNNNNNNNCYNNNSNLHNLTSTLTC